MEHKDLAKLNKIVTDFGITPRELTKLLRSSKGKLNTTKKINLSSTSLFYGYISDTHIGHDKFDENLFLQAANKFNKEKVDFVIHPGDHLESMSGRPGHIYELTHLGFNKQIEYCRNLYSEIKCKIYGINGNHDEWFKEKNNTGADVGEYLEKSLKNYVHLGSWEGDLLINNLKIKLFHGNSGTSYADSYRLQKLIESYSSGNKPHIVHSGHYHKALYLFRRGIHGFESGTICGQSIFMRGKNLPAHKGYGLVKVKYNKLGVIELNHTFFPAYY